jgi:hypothetical protein
MTTKRKSKPRKPRATVRPIAPPVSTEEMQEVIRHNAEQVETLVVKAPEPAPPPVPAPPPRLSYPGPTPPPKPKSLLLRFVDWFWGD